MSFDRPLLLLALLLVPPAVGLYALVQGRRRSYAVSFPNLEVLATVADGSRRRSHLPSALGLVVLAVLGLAVAGPRLTWNAPVEGAAVVLAVDASRSMLSEDVQPTRLEAAKEAARTFLKRVPGGFRVGIVVFAGDVAVAAFPTDDHEAVSFAIDAIAPREFPGTAIGDALARSVDLGLRALAGETGESGREDPSVSVAPDGAATILFLSDGRQEDGLLKPLEGSARARAAGIPVYTIAVGTEGGERKAGPGSGAVFGYLFDNVGTFRVPDLKTMRTIAATTGGEFFEAKTEEALTSAYKDLGSSVGRAPRQTEVTVALLGIAAALLLAAVLLSALRWPRLQ